MSSTTHPTTYAAEHFVEPHTGNHLPTAKTSDLHREVPVSATSKVTALADDEDDASSRESPPERCSIRCVGRALVRDWRFLVAYLMPILLLPMPLILRENRWWCLYVLLLMAMFWVTECIPVAVTGLLPALILPLAGVMGIKDLAPDYWKEVQFLLMGAIILGLLVQKSGLHLRIALRILSLLGDKIALHLAGFMFVSWFLSMWMSNTAATALMLPIAEALLDQYRRTLDQRPPSKATPLPPLPPPPTPSPCTSPRATAADVPAASAGNGPSLMRHATWPEPLSTAMTCCAATQTDDEGDVTEAIERRMKRVAKMLYMAVAYASTIGGVATLIGTPTNLILVETLQLFHGTNFGLNFTTWFLFAFPIALIMYIFSWAWLLFHFLGFEAFRDICRCRKRDKENNQPELQKLMLDKYKSLGPISTIEWVAMVYVLLVVLLWVTREPGFVPGWAALLTKDYATDAMPGLLVIALCLVTPAFLVPSARGKFLVSWKEFEREYPWTLLFIVGGGFAISEAAIKSKLTEMLANAMAGLQVLPAPIIMFIVTLAASAATEFATNVAIVTILLPIIVQMCDILRLHPLYLALPITIATSFAFMLPMGTVPNALVYSKGYFSQIDMAKTGFGVDVIGQIVLCVSTLTYGSLIFDFSTPPPPLVTRFPNTTTTASFLTSSELLTTNNSYNS